MCSSDLGKSLGFFQAEDGIRDSMVTGVQTCALPISADMVEAGVRLVDGPRQTGDGYYEAAPTRLRAPRQSAFGGAVVSTERKPPLCAESQLK